MDHHMDHDILRPGTAVRRLASLVTLTLALAVTVTPSVTAAAMRPDDGPRAASRAEGPGLTSDTASRGTERGTRFRPTAVSQVTALRYYRVAGDRGQHVARLWAGDSTVARRVVVPASRSVGWQRVALGAPVRVSPMRTYVLSYSVKPGVPYAVQRSTTAGTSSRYQVVSGVRGLRGAYPAKELKRTRFLVRPIIGKAGPASDAPDAPAGPPAAFPNAANTGVPESARLSAYTGPAVIRTDGAVIDGKQVDRTLTIQARGVVITRSMVNANIVVGPAGSATISDTTVDGGTFDGSAIGQYNVTLRRVEVVGARQSVSCNQGCDVQDSWLHAQYMPPGSDWHGDGFTSNGGSDMLLRHNTLACDSRTSGNGGCSAAVALFGDFNPIRAVTVDGNLFAANQGAYCLYGGFDPAKPHGADASGVVITDNVFQRGGNGKCAGFGAVTAVPRAGAGNVFEGNVWDDGAKVRAP